METRQLLETGMLEEKLDVSGVREVEYSMRFLDERHMPQIMDLQEIIVNNLSRRDMLQAFSYDFMKKHISPQGFIIGVFVGKRMVAFRNVYYPDSQDAEWNLGIDIGLPAMELPGVANLQMVCVHPAFRGNLLASKMNRHALRLLKEKNTHHHICATVSPYNFWNVRILLQSGFVIKKLKDKYGGKIRYVVYQNLKKPMQFEVETSASARLNDIEEQKKLFNTGLCGVALEQIASLDCTPRDALAGCFNVLFKKLKSDHER
ncbi:MAG: hypothetical protein KKH68_00735 [Proteobacteria bacterium]|nr:hypothetical protein [Pseudomonadota bacterium]